MERKALSKWSKFFDDLHKVKTVGQLVDYIPSGIIEKIVFAILIIWTTTPTIILFYGISARLPDDPSWMNYLNQINVMSINWYVILLQLGFIGILLGILHFVKSVRKSRKDNININKFFSNRTLITSLFLMLVWSIIAFFVNAYELSTLTDGLTETLLGKVYKRDGIVSYLAIAGIFSCAYMIRDKVYIIWILRTSALMTTLQSFLIIIDIKNINQFLGLTEDSGVFLNINHAGYYLCMGVMCTVYLILADSKTVFRLGLNYLMYAMIIAALVINSSLGPYLATVCALISCVILAIWLNRDLLSKITPILIVFVIVTFMANIVNGKLSSALLLFGLELKWIQEGEIAFEMGSNRVGLWKLALDFIKERPFFGYGPGGITYWYLDATGSHNRQIGRASCRERV